MRKRGLCRVCLSSRALTSRERVWTHTAVVSGRRVVEKCPGGRMAPLGTAVAHEPLPLKGQTRNLASLTKEGSAGTVYLLHFDRPFGHARHYIGFANPGNLHRRLSHHGTRSGANLMFHVARAGIRWRLVRTWHGGRTLERSLKNHGHARRCPECRPEVLAALVLKNLELSPCTRLTTYGKRL